MANRSLDHYLHHPGKEIGALHAVIAPPGYQGQEPDSADPVAFFGEDVIRRLLDGAKPGWQSDLRTVRERHACHAANTADPE